MGSPQLSFQTGYFTSTGASGTIILPFVPTTFQTINLTQANSSANPGVVKRASFEYGMVSGSYYAVSNTNSAATDQTSLVTTNGFTPIDLANPPTFASSTITGITQASSAVVTTSAPHGLSVGNLVFLNNTTGMLQIAGYVFNVLTVPSSTTFTIALNSSGFAAAGTGGTVTRIFPTGFSPRNEFITAISQSAQAVVTLSAPSSYVAGDRIAIYVPPSYGMVQMNTLIANVVSVSGNNITTNINSTSFTAFAFPASAAFVTNKASIAPAGNTSSNVIDPSQNILYKGMFVGSAVCGVASDVISWKAWYPDAHQTNVALV